MAAPAVQTADAEKVMLEVVAEETGYPTEMLDLEMDMEADLGIDSIKRRDSWYRSRRNAKPT